MLICLLQQTVGKWGNILGKSAIVKNTQLSFPYSTPSDRLTEVHIKLLKSFELPWWAHTICLFIPFLMERVAARKCNLSFQRYNTNIIRSATVTALAVDSRMLTDIPQLSWSAVSVLCAGQVGISACDQNLRRRYKGTRISFPHAFQVLTTISILLRTWWGDKMFSSICWLYGKHMDLSQGYRTHSWRLA